MLEKIGIYGWEVLERFLVASIAGKFSVLLVGGSGTAKTEGAERLFMALEKASDSKLKWGYRNASTAQVEDMTGFPLIPPIDKAWEMHARGEMPTMIWVDSPQSIRSLHFLIADEFNRIPPMTQNKWFSIIAERRIDGTKTNIEAIFAAMNPIEEYEGTEPLDRALADRFVWLLRPPGFSELSESDKKKIASTRMVFHEDSLPFGARIEMDACLDIANAVSATRKKIAEFQTQKGGIVADYAVAVASGLSYYGIESRRVAMIAQGILALHAASVVLNGEHSLLVDDAYEALCSSMVHSAIGVEPPDEGVLLAVHEQAKIHLESDAATLDLALRQITDPVDRVGLCVAMNASSERLSDEIMATHNALMKEDSIFAATFAVALLLTTQHRKIQPSKFVIDELSAWIGKILQASESLPTVSLTDGHPNQSEELCSIAGRIGEYAETPSGRMLLGLAVLAEGFSMAAKSNSPIATQVNPALKKYIHFSRRLHVVETFMRSCLFALTTQSDS